MSFLNWFTLACSLAAFVFTFLTVLTVTKESRSARRIARRAVGARRELADVSIGRINARGLADAYAVLTESGDQVVSAHRVPLDDVLELSQIILKACEENDGVVRDADLHRTLGRLIADMEPDTALRGIVGLQLLLEHLDHRVRDRGGEVHTADVHHPSHAAEPTSGAVAS